MPPIICILNTRLSMKIRSFLTAILLTSTTASAQIIFSDHFYDRTMRFDFYHAGNSTDEAYYFDAVKAEPYWAGSKHSLIDTTGLGNQFFRIVEKASERVIYSRGYCTLFNEWQDTPEALTTSRAYPEALIFPYPKHPCRIEIFTRDKQGAFVQKFAHELNPESYWIEPFTPRHEVFDVVYHGSTEHRVDIVVLPEGYSHDERAKFEEACRIFAEAMFTYAPYDTLKEHFNIRAVWAPSEQSGVTIPGEHIWRNTACKANFYTFDSERYQTVVDQQQLRDLAAHVPYEYIYVLSNTQKYGGGGIFNFYGISAAHNPDFTGKIYIHEFGHLLMGLGDEYVGTTAYDDTMYDKGLEPWEPNLTTLVDFDRKTLWKQALKETTPTPTPTTEKYAAEVGVYEGGGYAAKGIYRPAQRCLMSSFRGVEAFCPVCQAAIRSYVEFLCE